MNAKDAEADGGNLAMECTDDSSEPVIFTIRYFVSCRHYYYG